METPSSWPASSPPDVVIMQVQMPFERAKQTLKAMRAFPEAPKVVIVHVRESALR